MPTIVPRWEWRAFADDFGAVDSRFDALSSDSMRSTDETYVVSLESDASVKVRDGLVDVKVLEQVSGDALQQWRPVLKAAYPLSADDVRVAASALGLGVPGLARLEYTREQLVEEVLRPRGELLAVRVHKRRAHYTLGGCMAERSEMRTEHGTRQTIGIESEDPDLVRATVHELGFDTSGNVCLPRELKLLAGFGAHA